MRCNQVMHKVICDITKKLTTCTLSGVKYRKAFVDAITWFSNFVLNSDSSLSEKIFSISVRETNNRQSLK